MRRASVFVLIAVLAACGRAPDDSWQGYVEGEFVLLASPYSGQLQRLHVRRGEQVAAGQPVFTLEQENERAARLEAEERLNAAQARLENLQAARRAPEIEAQRAEIAQAKAALELSATQLAQQEKLFKAGFVSQARLDEARSVHARDAARMRNAEAQLSNLLQPLGRDAERKAAEGEVAAARAAVEQANWRLAQKSVIAPVSGLVQDTIFVEGEWVPAGRPVVSLLPPGNVKARFYVPEMALSAFPIGGEVEILCDGCQPVSAKVSFVSSQAEYTPPVLYSKEARQKLMFLVEAQPAPADGAKLRPGQPIDVKPGTGP
ncbi:MAG: HlyD family efflux transporter periplasmic adaptor subunit [Betaproteobacteria bacterium]|nr:HlyD family efflux transporter periplasmic adaptor subunit [Betaproteobacteria bacterium]MDH3437460.1 HlyD family efflux transporter periplasmic adaptor subunit [Betaproteobacteria bacterium]